MNNKLKKSTIIIYVFLLQTTAIFSQNIDLSEATIVCFENKDKLVLKSVSVLQEEIYKKTDIELTISKKWPKSLSTIAIGIEGQLDNFSSEFKNQLSQLRSIGIEGYKILSSEKTNTVLVIGHDARGVLYGVGKLLRKMELRNHQILLPNNLKIASTPKYPIRGHQLGYRPKTNAYDAFSSPQFDSYIRDLAIFGANSIEIVPPRTDDDFTSVHMKIPAIEMISEQSKICESYGMDVWMWYPNMGTNYSNPDSLKVELDERHKVFKAVPKLDALFVPGGDPGELEPDELFEWLETVSKVLHQYHPKAKIWVSPQVFRPTQKWFDAFYTHVNKEYSWFGGVVFGPWIKTPIEEMRALINPGIPIRKYPDITHSLSSQYPVPKWDLAYATTLGRECINPRPTDEKLIHNALDEYGQGSISYSEGTNDDVNKMVWSDQDWNPETPVIETLRDYARYFIGPDYTESVAQGILNLEKNIQGPLLVNNDVIRTLQQWQELEKNATEKILSNPRFQMGLIRAYFDAYTYRRLIYETELEQAAREVLTVAKQIGSITAMNQAKNILKKATDEPIMTDVRTRCYALADSLFRSIGAQLTIEKHNAMDGRGNFMDNIDLPLNDIMWMNDKMTFIKNHKSEEKRLFEIDKMLQRTNPGPGGFYDNFGSPKSWERIVSRVTREEDPCNLASPRTSFGIGLEGEEWVHNVTAVGFEGQASPSAWMNQITTLYDQPLEIEYNNLDPTGSYTIKVAYTGRFPSKIKMVADNIFVHDYIKTGTQPIYEFEVPKAANTDGNIVFKWTCGEGERGSQVAEIWLIKK
jgi:hypothetical protein